MNDKRAMWISAVIFLVVLLGISLLAMRNRSGLGGRAAKEQDQPGDEPPSTVWLRDYEKEFLSGVEKIAALNTKESIEVAQDLVKVAQRHNLPVCKRMQELDSRNHRAIGTDGEWTVFYSHTLGLTTPWEERVRSGHAITKESFDLYSDILIALSQQQASVALRFDAAIHLSNKCPVQLERAGSEVLPSISTTFDQVSVSFKLAFEKLLEAGHNRSEFDLLSASRIMVSKGASSHYIYLRSLAEVSRLSDEKKLVEFLAAEEQRIVATVQSRLATTKSQREKEAFGRLESYFLKNSSQGFPRQIGKAAIARKQIEPLLKAWINAINGDDAAKTLAYIVDVTPDFKKQILETKPVIRFYTAMDDVKRLEYRSIGELSAVVPDDDRPECETTSLTMFVENILADGERRQAQHDLTFLKVDGKWYGVLRAPR